MGGGGGGGCVGGWPKINNSSIISRYLNFNQNLEKFHSNFKIFISYKGNVALCACVTGSW